ncbi:unnamed protein product [Adineta steineri]|uniref:B box-type domain-containing protein n=2 Tax=Adineta steineri TaxID=433720 RepID=A0A818XDD7_9BILA|nr:unnamed protein product [Adineta steineri]
MEAICVQCKNTGCIAMCYGCQESFCTKHFIKHRLYLSEQMDDIHRKYESFQKDLNRNNFEQTLLTSIHAWERKSIMKIQEIAEKARYELQQTMDNTKNDVQVLLNEIFSEFQSNSKTDNYTENDLDKWTRQLSELQNLLEKSANIFIVQDKKSSALIRGIKLTFQQQQKQSLNSNVILKTNQDLNESIQEHFRIISGPCRLSDNDCIATHLNYRAGLSRISGIQQYSFGKHAIPFLIEKKGNKNIFIGIHSSSKSISSTTFDYSVHGWWNLDYMIINGESKGGDNNEIIQTGDRITLIIDCDNQKLYLEHDRTKRLEHLPIKLDVCPFPWKILVRLLTTGDCIRIIN